MSPRSTIFCLGVFWVAIGFGLLFSGGRLVQEIAATGGACSRFFGVEPGKSGLIILAFGLLLGLLKSRYIFSPIALGKFQLAIQYKERVPFFKVYNFRYIATVAGMISCGIFLRKFDAPLEARALFSIAIGSALLNAAPLCFRLGQTLALKK